MAQEVGFSDKQKAALSIAEEVRTLAVTTATEHAAVGLAVNTIRDLEKELEAEYKAHPVILEAKRIQAVKSDIAEALEGARKAAKARMMAYEDAEEAKRKEAEARQQAEAQKLAEDEALAAAAEAEKAGDITQAQEILEAPVIAPTVVLPKTVAKVQGHSRRMVPKFRIVNALAIKREFLSPDMVKIGGVVRSLGQASVNIVGGIEFYEEAA